MTQIEKATDTDDAPHYLEAFPVLEYLRQAVSMAMSTGRTQADIAHAAGVAPAALNRALVGKHDPTAGTVAKILHACGCRLDLVTPETPAKE